MRSPAVMADTPVRPETASGVVDDVVVPVPSSPTELLPQHLTVPPLRRAQLCPLPAATAVAPERPETDCGVVAEVVVPVPS